MIVYELFENIRMGYKDISRPSKKDYTYGVELEIIVSDDILNENQQISKLLDRYSNGSYNKYLMSYIEKNLIDELIWDNAATVEAVVKHFEDVTNAKLKSGAKIKKYKNYYVAEYQTEKKVIDVTFKTAFLDSIGFAYDFSTLSQDKNFLYYLERMVKKDFQKNKSSYLSMAKLKYLQDTLSDYIDINIVELDSSVPQGGEVVSSVYSDLNKFLFDLKRTFKKIEDDEYLSTDMTTGLHINIGTWKSDEIQNLDVLKFFLIADTMGILKDFDRVGSEYAVPVGDKLKNAVRELNILDYFNVSKDITNKIINGADKFDNINFSKLPFDGYIEVRGFGNADYEKRFTDIKNHILKLIRVLDISQDPDSYKNEYMKKLFKFLDTNSPESNESLSTYQSLILKDFKKWGKPANINAYIYDVDTIEDMARWIRGFVESSRSNTEYLKKIGNTIPPNLALNMMKFIREKKSSNSKISFNYEFKDAQNIIEMVMNEYYLEYESPKLKSFLERIFNV